MELNARELAWDSCVNARDLGGLGRIRPGALVRMEQPGHLTEAGWAAAWAQEIIADYLLSYHRMKQRYDGAVERGQIDAAKQSRGTLSALLAELGRNDPDLEAQLRRDMKFPVGVSWF